MVVAFFGGCSSVREQAAQEWSVQNAYSLLLDRFNNGNNSNDYNLNLDDIYAYGGGDLNGLTQKIEFIKGLRFSTIMISPLMENRKTPRNGKWASHGYWIVDHYKLDPHWGTVEDLKEFTEARIKNDMKFILDVVVDQVDDTHPWLQQHPDWFQKQSTSFDFENDEVLKELIQYTKHWIDLTKADGIRVSSVQNVKYKFLKKYISKIRDFMSAKYNKKDFLFLAEAQHQDLKDYKSYVDAGFSAILDYPLYNAVVDVFGKKDTLLKLPLQLQTEDQLFPKDMILSTFVDHQNTPRFLSQSKTTTALDLHQALAFYSTLRGLPTLYYGTEARFRGQTGETGRFMMEFTDLVEAGYIRKLNDIRKKFPSLSVGVREDLFASSTMYVYRKATENEETLIFITRSLDSVNFEFPIEKKSLFSQQTSVIDQLTGRTFDIQDDKIKLNLLKKDFVILTANGLYLKYPSLKRGDITIQNVKMRLKLPKALQPGEKLYLSGNQKNLGNWDTQKALGPLQKVSALTYEISFDIPLHKVLEYKFLKLDGKKNIVLEEIPNRMIFIDTKTQELKSTWNKSERI